MVTRVRCKERFVAQFGRPYRSGRATHGAAEALGYPDQYLTKACAINTAMFWSSVHDGLRELRRALGPQGKLVVILREQQETALIAER